MLCLHHQLWVLLCGIRLKQGGAAADSGHPFDVFSEFFGGFGFGGFGGRGGNRVPQAPSSILKVRVSLEQLYHGASLDFSFSRPVLCINADECMVKKKDCKGPGVRVVTQQMGPGFIVQNQIQDDSCVDQGRAWMPDCKVSLIVYNRMAFHTLFLAANMRWG